MHWYHIPFIAVIVEALISYFKMVGKNKKMHYEVIASAVIGIAITLSFNMNLFDIIIESKLHCVGNILTGILVSRLSNYTYDLLKKICGTETVLNNLNKLYSRPIDEINTDIVDHEV